MRPVRVFRTIESHTGGNPTRTILSGVPPVPGATMLDKMHHLGDHMDGIRRLLMYEPRGHGVMSGCILTEPTTPGADLGVVYIEVGGYLPMCGHDTIGLVTALVETGQIPLPAGADGVEVALDTPSGVVRAWAEVRAGRVVEVRFDNVPSFLYRRDLEVAVDGLGPVRLDIAWGGNFYGLVEAATVGVQLEPAGARDAIRKARAIRAAVDRILDVAHPLLTGVRGLSHVEFYGPPASPAADVRNMVIVPPGGVDRSPCGTGTSAKAAVLFGRGELGVGGSFVHESVTGATFRATILATDRVGPFEAVRVRIAGSARVYGESTFVLGGDDPLPEGFFVP
jgi:proline racemase